MLWMSVIVVLLWKYLITQRFRKRTRLLAHLTPAWINPKHLWHTGVFSITSSLFYLFFFLSSSSFSFFLMRVWFRQNNSFLGNTVIMQHHLGFKQCINQLVFQNGQKPQMPSLVFSISKLYGAKEKPKLHLPFLVLCLKDNIVPNSSPGTSKLFFPYKMVK